jgi:hypothetical protein
MEGEGRERSSSFSLQSIFLQVLKPLDVKTKFYNAEVSLSWRLAKLAGRTSPLVLLTAI